MDERVTDAEGHLIDPIPAREQVVETFVFPNGDWNIMNYNDAKEHIGDELKHMLRFWPRLMLIDILIDLASDLKAGKDF
jgi:hypothetical protein